MINDRARDVANLFRILQRHYPQFLDILRFQLTTRTEFQRLVATDPDTLTDLERAARFLYLQRTAFGGKVSGRNFGVSLDRLDWSAFLRRYDGAGTLFYLDPPYWGCEGAYGKALFTRDDFARMAEQLRALRGRWLLSINDVPELRALFAWAQIEPVQTSYGIAASVEAKRQARAGLLIGSPP